MRMREATGRRACSILFRAVGVNGVRIARFRTMRRSEARLPCSICIFDSSSTTFDCNAYQQSRTIESFRLTRTMSLRDACRKLSDFPLRSDVAFCGKTNVSSTYSCKSRGSCCRGASLALFGGSAVCHDPLDDTADMLVAVDAFGRSWRGAPFDLGRSDRPAVTAEALPVRIRIPVLRKLAP